MYIGSTSQNLQLHHSELQINLSIRIVKCNKSCHRADTTVYNFSAKALLSAVYSTCFEVLILSFRKLSRKAKNHIFVEQYFRSPFFLGTLVTVRNVFCKCEAEHQTVGVELFFSI